jgi:arylsulfatase A-like enzyme
MRQQSFRCALGIVVLAGTFLGFAFGQESAPGPKSKPLNVLFIISDDLRTECSCYGGLAKTPNIDKLAAAGIRFDRAYCQFPLCNPSRSSLLTGRYPTTTGILGNRGFFGDAHPDFVSLPKWFMQHGYVTLRTGKIFHGGIDDTEAWTEGGEPRIAAPDSGAKDTTGRLPSADPDEASPVQGKAAPAQVNRAERSDRFIILPGDGSNHGDYRCATQAIDYLRRFKDSDKPFFIGCGFVKPHSPPTAPQKFYDMYDLDKIELPPNFAPRPTVPEGFPKLSIRPRNADLFIGRDASPQEAKEMIRAYLASTSFVDANVGRVIAELDKLGMRDKTIVIFWGDHGYQLGERGKWSKAGSLFEQGGRVPLIILAPGAKGNGQPCERVIECVDLYPTLCELCSLPQPPGLEGQSLEPLLEKPAGSRRSLAFTVWSEDGQTLHGVAIRTERWRYAEFDGGKGGAMLFDEDADPQELKNLADDPKYAAVCAELSPLVKQYAARMAAKQ